MHKYTQAYVTVVNIHNCIIIKVLPLQGQFWNVPATVVSPECEDFTLFSSLPLYKVLLPNNRAIPVIHHTRQWNRDGSCLHASLQGPSVIDGTPEDYTVSNLLTTEYKYSKFSTRCV